MDSPSPLQSGEYSIYDLQKQYSFNLHLWLHWQIVLSDSGFQRMESY